MHLVGTDVGTNSLGLASIEVDKQFTPVRANRLMVALHDNGRDGMASGSGGAVSRKASAGSARRVRRLYRNRKRRAAKLEQVLSKLEYPIVDPETLNTYDEWHARHELLDSFISDEQRRKRLISISIRHMSNHRGWVNAWVRLDAYLWKEEPTPEFLKAVESLVESERFDFEVLPKDIEFQADLAAFGLRQEERLRPRNPSKPGANAVPIEQGNLLGSQRRIDVVREWREICRTQRITDEVFEQLARAAFAQEPPYVPAENVGNDWLSGFEHQKRASRASLEHQEFHIRQEIANLRVLEGSQRRRLSIDEQSRIFKRLWTVTSKNDAPTWKDIAEEILGISPRSLVTSDIEGSSTSVAPVARSVSTMNSLPKSHPIRKWWESAADRNQREFIRWIADPVKTNRPSPVQSQIEPLLESLNERQADDVQKLSFPAGRSAHCVDTLELMSAEIERTGLSYVEVRNSLFGEDGANTGPEKSTLDVVSDHPTLQRILPPLRRFLNGIVHIHGKPERVVVEHVRSAFQGFQARESAITEQRKNERDRDRAREQIQLAYGIAEPSRHQIRKVQAFERQGSRCLYCGDAANFTDIEMDHIVPRKTGGNSTRANLVAVCRTCNSVKGKRAFAVFAGSSDLPKVSLEATLQRVDELERGLLDQRSFTRLKREMKRRLKQTELDDPIDERSLASTAYAAIDVRERVQGSFDVDVPVYSGRIIQAARKASGIDQRIQIRDGVHTKSRFDRRHHAIDAAVAAMINPSIARTLAEREDLRNAALESKSDRWSWTEYEGSEAAAISKFRKWKSDMVILASLIRDAIERDEVVVTHPVRFSANHAALHEAGRSPHLRKQVGDNWSAQERARIVDNRVYLNLSESVAPSDLLPSSTERTLVLPSGKRIDADGNVFIFPDPKARMPLPNKSSAPLGQSMHHVRLYRWPNAKGGFKAGIVRVWSADLYEMENGLKDDLLSSPFPIHAQPVRRADLRLQTAMHEGVAEHVGTFVIGDEILIDPKEWTGTNETGRFLDEFPEKHWRLSGWEEIGRANLRPILLSDEGARQKPEDRSNRLVDVSPLALKVLKSSLRITSAKLWSTPSTTVIRRTATGMPRWSPSSGLPVSWSPHKAVHGA